MLRIKTLKPGQAIKIADALRLYSPEFATHTLPNNIVETEAPENRVLDLARLVEISDNAWCRVTERVLVMWLDYTGAPRAWGSAPVDMQAEAERIADEQLTLYCGKQAKLGELDLADRSKYTRKIERYNGEG